MVQSICHLLFPGHLLLFWFLLLFLLLQLLLRQMSTSSGARRAAASRRGPKLWIRHRRRLAILELYSPKSNSKQTNKQKIWKLNCIISYVYLKSISSKLRRTKIIQTQKTNTLHNHSVKERKKKKCYLNK